ncbi:MAG: S-layer homology domain-containing protein [Defluviitaleaceae bacterium]|nr:S-layer homology domain-containing protein [Defluviitaleaceae bacterium]
MKRYSRMRCLAAAVLAMIMTVAFTLPVTANNQTTPFRDVPATHFAFNAINWISHPDNGGIMVGDAAGNFHPNQTLNKFEAARVYAMAAGYRPASHTVAADLRAEINRSFEQWRPFLDSMAAQHPQWSRIADREIAFLLYRNVLTTADVEKFIGTRLTNQEAVAWMVRLIGRQAHAAAIVIPFSNPFNDDALIAQEYIRYVYYARQAGYIAGGGGNMFNPTNEFTRAQVAVLFYNVLGDGNIVPPPGSTTPSSTVSGTVEMVYRNTQVFISSPLGPQNYHITQDATIIVDNVQRSAAFIRVGMSINAVLNAQGEIISLVARTVAAETNQPQPQPSPGPVTTPITLVENEGFVISTLANPATITIRTQWVRITGQIVNEERTFTFAPNAKITRGGVTVPLSDAQQNDIAFFRFNGTVIYELELEDREREVSGTLLERRSVDTQGNQVIIIETLTGELYELRVTAVTLISRGNRLNVTLADLRIGDAVTATLESGTMTKLHAVGQQTIVQGRLTEIRINQHLSQITVLKETGHSHVYTIMPGMYDIYSLRIGMDIRIFLDSWEVMDIQVVAQSGQQTAAVLGYIQAIRTGQQLVVISMDGQTQRSHTIIIDNTTINTATGARLDFNQLRVNMNIYIVMVGPQSNVARAVTILP